MTTSLMAGESGIRSRSVFCNGIHQYELLYLTRHDVRNRHAARHGVVDESIITQYEEALCSAHRDLAGEVFQWRDLRAPGELPREAVVRDLGTNILGAAVRIGAPSAYLALSCRLHEASEEAARNRRMATVIHELVHLFQFETPIWQYWANRGRVGMADPNWWLHEAIALATEAILGPQPIGWIPWLWDWTTAPELSMDSDPGGCLAAPFFLYAMQVFGSRLGSAMYRLDPGTLKTVKGSEIVATFLEREFGATFSSNTAESCVFADYCLEAGLHVRSESILAQFIPRIVGCRVPSDRFQQFPVHTAAANLSIDHLGCRYFEFIPESTSGKLTIQVTPASVRSRQVLRADLAVISPQGIVVHRKCFSRDSSTGTMIACIADFDAGTTECVLVVVSNCGHGEGWAEMDDARFEIAAFVV